MTHKAYLLARFEFDAHQHLVFTGFGIYSEEQPTSMMRGVWATVTYAEGTSFQAAFDQLVHDIRTRFPDLRTRIHGLKE